MINKNLIKWLKENNFTFKNVTMTDGKIGVMIDTNYKGQYPTKEVFDMHNLIRNKLKRLKGLTATERGHYTAMLVMEV